MIKPAKMQRLGGIVLAVLTLLLALVHIWMPFASEAWSWVINFLPLAAVTVLVLLRGHKPGVCADTIAILLAIAQGILWGVAAAAGIGLISAKWSPWYAQHPCDELAFGMILLLSVLLISVIFFTDLIKHDETNSGKRMFLQFCITVSLAIPVCIPAMELMEYFEGILSQFVS